MRCLYGSVQRKMYLKQLLLLLCSAHIVCAKFAALPSEIQPLFYNISLVTHLGERRNSFEGSVDILVKIFVRDATNITLHAKELKVNERIPIIRMSSGRRVTVKRVEWLPEDEQLIIYSWSHLWLGEQYKLTLNFSGKLNRTLGYRRGWYAADEEEGERQLYAVTQLVPQLARTIFPCFDEPQLRTNFSIRLAHHGAYTAISNMPIASTEPHGHLEGYRWTIFETTPRLSTHLLAWALHKFENKSKTVKQMTYVIWTRPSEIERTSYPLRRLPEVMRDCETQFGQPFSNQNKSQLVLLALPHFALAMSSYYGLHIYNEETLLLDYKEAQRIAKQMVTEKMALQLVRHFQGQAMEMASGHWLDDGLAQYLAVSVPSRIESVWLQYNDSRLLLNLVEVLLWDSSPSSLPINSTKTAMATATQQVQKFWCLAYMLETALGAQNFYKALHNYWTGHLNTTAQPGELWTVLQAGGRRAHVLPFGIDFTSVMESWLSQPGYPVLRVERNDFDHTVIISQERFIMQIINSTEGAKEDGNVTVRTKAAAPVVMVRTKAATSAIRRRTATAMVAAPALSRKSSENETRSAEACWWLPISYTTQNSPQHLDSAPLEWLTCEPDAPELATVTLNNVTQPDEWLLINVKATQQHRTLYDMTNWQLLNATLHSQNYMQIPAVNRALLLDDALNFAWTGQLNYELALWMLSYLKVERNAMIWQVALVGLKRLQGILRFTTGYRIFTTFMRQLVKPLFKVHVNANEQLTWVIYNTACHVELNECVTDARKRFDEASKPNSALPPPEMRETVYCMGVRYGLEEDWTMLRQVYNMTSELEQRRIILAGLACSTEPWALEKLLRWAQDKKVVPRHLSAGVYAALAQNPLGNQLVREQLASNVERFKQIYTNDTIVDFLQPLLAVVTKPEHLQELKSLIEKHWPHLSTELAEANVQWLKLRYYPLLHAIRNVTLQTTEKSEVVKPNVEVSTTKLPDKEESTTKPPDKEESTTKPPENDEESNTEPPDMGEESNTHEWDNEK